MVSYQLYRDMACSGEYDGIRPLYYLDTNLFMICFSIDNPQSYQNAINRWMGEIDRFAEGGLKIFVCTKMDRVENDFATMDVLSRPTLPFTMVKIVVFRWRIGSMRWGMS
jgi:GTPase SAR1 family protein